MIPYRSLLFIATIMNDKKSATKSNISHFTLMYKSCHTSYLLHIVSIRFVSDVVQLQSISYTKNLGVSFGHNMHLNIIIRVSKYINHPVQTIDVYCIFSIYVLGIHCKTAASHQVTANKKYIQL